MTAGQDLSFGSSSRQDGRTPRGTPPPCRPSTTLLKRFARPCSTTSARRRPISRAWTRSRPWSPLSSTARPAARGSKAGLEGLGDDGLLTPERLAEAEIPEIVDALRGQGVVGYRRKASPRSSILLAGWWTIMTGLASDSLFDHAPVDSTALRGELAGIERHQRQRRPTRSILYRPQDGRLSRRSRHVSGSWFATVGSIRRQPTTKPATSSSIAPSIEADLREEDAASLLARSCRTEWSSSGVDSAARPRRTVTAVPWNRSCPRGDRAKSMPKPADQKAPIDFRRPRPTTNWSGPCPRGCMK